MSTITVTGKIGKIQNCPECSGANLVEDYDLGEIICHDCGLVLSEHALNQGPEWRAFIKKKRMNVVTWSADVLLNSRQGSLHRY